MVEQSVAVGAVLLMTLVTVATRFSGVWIMSFVDITPRIEAFLKYLAVSVLISIVVPATLNASPRIWLAVASGRNRHGRHTQRARRDADGRCSGCGCA